MALRQTRGILPGVLDQEDVTQITQRYLIDLPVEGKQARAGLVTAPMAGEVVEIGMGDPVVMGSGSDSSTPQGTDTKEATKQQSDSMIPLWLLLGAAALALL